MDIKEKYNHYCYVIKYRLHMFLIKIGIPLCHGSHGPCFKFGKRRHQFTAYCDNEQNYVFVCEKCLDQIKEYWQERWDEYYSGLR